MTLRDAIEFVSSYAPRDGYIVRVSGEITAAPNVLIPSTTNALTGFNYQSRAAKVRAKRTKLHGFELDYLRKLPTAADDWSAKLYSKRIESGVVNYATWLMIQAMPAALRQEYENLVVDTVLFYPSRFITHDGAEFDRLVEQLQVEHLPWSAVIDVDGGQIIRTEHFDADYVTLRFLIGELAQRVGELREEAKRRDGKGSGAEKSWKLLANSMFGVLACDHLETANHVAANQVTATARAIACGMMLSLNGIQVITDGCTYRADQIPAVTFAECLRHQPDYPLRRAESPGPIAFHEAVSVPTNNREFTAWFRRNVKRFFDVRGEEYDHLFGLHSLEHKVNRESGAIAFDALAVDGSGNYVKCTADGAGGWNGFDMAARSYKQSKAVLRDWLVTTYSSDMLTELPPLTTDTLLLKPKPARQKARKALNRGIPEVFLPSGMPCGQVLNYRLIKSSGFVFQTSEQLRAFEKMYSKFMDEHACGLELLALRRSSRGRRRGSIADIAAWIYSLIQEGVHDFVGPLNLNRWSASLKSMVAARREDLFRQRAAAEQRLFDAIDTRNLREDGRTVGYFVRSENQVVAELRGPDVDTGAYGTTGWGVAPDAAGMQ